MEYKTTDLCDAFEDEVSVCSPIFRSFGGKKMFHGVITTVQVYEDNTLVRQAIETVPAGSVIVVDGGASTRTALLGDNLAALALERGIAGFVIYGGVRDAAELAQMDIGVKALHAVPRKSKKEGKGQRDIPLQFGGVQWIPGHWVYADEDGIIVSAKQLSL